MWPWIAPCTFFGPKVTKALRFRISHGPCASIDQVFTPHLATRSSSLEKFSIDTWTDRLPFLERLWRRERRKMLSKKFFSARPRWRVIRGCRQDALWSRVRWRAEMRPDLFGRK